MAEYIYAGFWANGTNNLNTSSYSDSGGGHFTYTNDLTRSKGEDLAVSGVTPEEPLTLNAWSTRSENGVVRNGVEVTKVAQLINTINGAKTAIRGRARFEYIFDDRLTAAQRTLLAGAILGILTSVNSTASPGEGLHYKVSSAFYYRLKDGLFVPEAGIPA